MIYENDFAIFTFTDVWVIYVEIYNDDFVLSDFDSLVWTHLSWTRIFLLDISKF